MNLLELTNAGDTFIFLLVSLPFPQFLIGTGSSLVLIHLILVDNEHGSKAFFFSLILIVPKQWKAYLQLLDCVGFCCTLLNWLYEFAVQLTSMVLGIAQRHSSLESWWHLQQVIVSVAHIRTLLSIQSKPSSSLASFSTTGSTGSGWQVRHSLGICFNLYISHVSPMSI